MPVRFTSDDFPRESFVSIYLVRHADAGDRAEWDRPDRARPLTELGQEQAVMLAGLLGDQPLERLVSSPYTRCVETFEPLAQHRGLRIGTSEALAEGGTSRAAIELIVDLAAGGSSAVCTHGDLMMRTIGKLLDDGIQVATETRVGFEKGCTWVLEVHDGAIVSARYVPAPGAHRRRYQPSASGVAS